MVDMKPRNVATAQMIYRESSDSTTAHYTYNQFQVTYNQSFVTYNYSSNRGNLKPRILATSMMTPTASPTGSKVSMISRILATSNMRGR
jgi:hypothetical protein